MESAVSHRQHYVTKRTTYLSPLKKTSVFFYSKHELIEFKLKQPPFSGKIITQEHDHNQSADFVGANQIFMAS
jgi:hypothetical protein